MKKISKIILIIVIILPILIMLQIHILGQIYQLKKSNFTIGEITVEEYEQNAYYHSFSDEELLKKINKNPQQYIAFSFSFDLENTSQKELFLEDYSLKIPGYKIVSFRDDTDAGSAYEYSSGDENHLYGSMIVYIGNKERLEALVEIEKTIKIKAVYFIYDLFSFAVDVI